MTPNPPSSSDGSGLPPRHRPNMGNLAKDTTETDLWAFDEMDPEGEEPLAERPKSSEHVLPVPRDPDRIKARHPKDSQGSKAAGSGDRIKVNVNKPRPKTQAGPIAGQSKPGSDFDDLDSWDESEMEAEVPAVHPQTEPPSRVPEPVKEEIFREIVPSGAPEVFEKDEFSPVAAKASAPVSVQPRLNLTKVERIGLVSLLAILLIGGITVFLHTISRLPTGSELVKANNFPIKGTNLTIVSADSYWRAPKDADTVRRGTQLLPVVDMESSGGPAAIRVFFRDSDGELIGDAVTRLIRAGSKIEIGATAGFDDVGMHAAYRTGQNKPWTIEVHEAPTEDSPVADFKKVFEMNISTDRR